MFRDDDNPLDDRLPSHVPDVRPKWAGAYSVGLAYGGPEEGGWYATLWHPLGSALIRSDDDPMAVARELWEAFREHDDGRDIHSVLATGAVCVAWEDQPGEHAVRSVGRYE